MSFPGVVEVPVTFAPPNALVQPLRARRADVRVEVVERSLAEEDRVRERAVPRRERRGLARRVGDGERQERRLDRAQMRRAVQREPIPVDVCVRVERRQRLRLVRARDASTAEKSWKFGCGPLAAG